MELAAHLWSQSPNPAPPFDEEHAMCLKGPCRHFWRIVTHLDTMNAGTLEKQPIKISMSCLRQPGMEMDLSGDEPILQCNQWEPMQVFEIAERERLRDNYHEIVMAREQSMPIDDADGGGEDTDG